ncbi:MAG: DUF4442 domain-containing protein [Flavobacteriales bacterium]|nr:DUF4442 domain-containing protein [Flavobacteriales bacterium]
MVDFDLKKANKMLSIFGLTKIPLIFFCRPKILRIDDQSIVVKIPLKRRTRNHLKSMYFGALAVGADVTGGFQAFYASYVLKKNVGLSFKNFKCDFHRLAKGDVHFTCEDTQEVLKMVQETIETGERVERTVNIKATCPDIDPEEIVATMALTISMRYKKKGG